MSLRINDTIPDLTVETDQGRFGLHDWVGDNWAILFSHPKDFTPVCTTEFGAVAQLADEWAARGTKVMGFPWMGSKTTRNGRPTLRKLAAHLPDFRLLQTMG